MSQNQNPSQQTQNNPSQKPGHQQGGGTMPGQQQQGGSQQKPGQQQNPNR